MSSKYTLMYEDFKDKQKTKDKQEIEHAVANVPSGGYPKELYTVFDSLKREDSKLMEMREKYIKIDRTNIKERDKLRAELNAQYRTVVTLEAEFQRIMSYEERNYKEETI